MRKKGIAAALLVGLALRLAVLAGAGEDLARLVRTRWGDGALVRATLNVELGAPPEEAGEAAADTAAPAAAELTLRQDAAPADAAPIQLIEVTPSPRAEADGGERNALDDGSEAECAPAAVTIRAADLSGSAIVHNSTEISVDFDALASEGLTLRLPSDGPQVLIVHTHSSEAYTPDGTDQYAASDPYRTQDASFSVIRVGDALAEALEAHGLTVLHDRDVYDYPSYTGSYSRSGAAVERALAEHPSIRVVIDVHRDALGSGDVVYKTRAVVGVQQCAQVMLLAGSEAGGLPHPNWRENLKLAMYLQNAVTDRYPSLARPVELVAARYNQQLSPGMLILEVGSNGNTLREALTAVTLFGDAAGTALAALKE